MHPSARILAQNKVDGTTSRPSATSSCTSAGVSLRTGRSVASHHVKRCMKAGSFVCADQEVFSSGIVQLLMPLCAPGYCGIAGTLPWQGIKANTKQEKYHKIMEKKMSTPVEVLCKGYPCKLLDYTPFFTAIVHRLQFLLPAKDV